MICCHGYTNYVGNKQLITWVLKKYWEMFQSGFPKAQVIIPCPRTIIYNYCDQNIVSGYIFYYGGNVDEKEYFGFSGSFFKKSPSIIDNITKIKMANLNSTQLLNIYEKLLKDINISDKNKMKNKIKGQIIRWKTQW